MEVKALASGQLSDAMRREIMDRIEAIDLEMNLAILRNKRQKLIDAGIFVE